uniref:Hydrogenase maturation factor n=1 Tax=Candidatus Kentrum sp. TUN TaxID=2126343 RepID=A0A451APC8_9GAMM|nr:MAG: hydrogenase expression/formation protein HypD [Candidatus Kentron sp. TUN]VFK67862.1 MAG: hydrogenase expression/formation protein HypD [Candidatus Kentron sp. TUN]
MPLTSGEWLERIRALPLPTKFRIMNVCGGHERAITMAGLRSALPKDIELIPGPGCPVCICPEEDISTAIRIALHEDITLVAFGDMLRVPINAPKGHVRTLEQARTLGADIRPIASPRDAVHIAAKAREKTIIFFATGFETTIAPVAAMLAEGIPDNLFVLLSGRLTWPAVAMLLASGDLGFHAIIAPGHVSAVMGANEWAFVAEKHRIPVAVAGFYPETLLAGFYSVLRQAITGNYFLDNCYPEVVRPEGNRTARKQLNTVMTVVDAKWRGVGVIQASGFTFRAEFQQHDAREKFPAYMEESRRRTGEMPAGCDCAKVVLGRIYPDACRLYGKGCTPRNPIGPCMVSEEGACRIWWVGGVR